MHRTSIGTWAYNIGPYAERPIPFDVVGPKLKELGFDGLELGGFNDYPNPGDLPHREQRQALKDKVQSWGLGNFRLRRRSVEPAPDRYRRPERVSRRVQEECRFRA